MLRVLNRTSSCPQQLDLSASSSTVLFLPKADIDVPLSPMSHALYAKHCTIKTPKDWQTPIRPRFIPHTQIFWNAFSVANLLSEKLAPRFISVENQEDILELIHRLPIEDRKAIEAAFLSNTGTPLRDVFLEKLSAGNRFRALAYLDNITGTLMIHQKLLQYCRQYDRNSQDLFLFLQNCTSNEIKIIREELATYQKLSLEQIIMQELAGEQAKLAQIYVTAPRNEKNEIPISFLNAYQIEKILESKNPTNYYEIFRILEMQSKQEIDELALTFQSLFHKDLYATLRSALQTKNKASLWLERLDVAFTGIATNSQSAREYAAIALYLSSVIESNPPDISAILSNVLKGEEDKEPTFSQVSATYRRRFKHEIFNLMVSRRDLAHDLRRCLGKTGRLLVQLLSSGQSLQSPAAFAIKIYNLLDQKNESALVDLLSLGHIKDHQKPGFIEEIKFQYMLRFGKDEQDVHALENQIMQSFYALRSKTKSPQPKLLLLVQKGYLTREESLFFLLRESPRQVLHALRQLRDIEIRILHHTYASFVNSTDNPAENRQELFNDLKTFLSLKEYRKAQKILDIEPIRPSLLGQMLKEYIGAQTCDATLLWIQNAFVEHPKLVNEFAILPDQISLLCSNSSNQRKICEETISSKSNELIDALAYQGAQFVKRKNIQMIFRILEGLTPKETELWKNNLQTIHHIDEQELYRALPFGKSLDLWKERMKYALKGLQRNPDCLREYLAISLRLFIANGEISQNQAIYLLIHLIQPNGQGHPTAADICASYQRRYSSKSNELASLRKDMKKCTSNEARSLVEVTLLGYGAWTASGLAARLHHAIHRRTLRRNSKASTLRTLLNSIKILMPSKEFLAQIQQQYALRYGQSNTDFTCLTRDLAKFNVGLFDLLPMLQTDTNEVN